LVEHWLPKLLRASRRSTIDRKPRQTLRLRHVEGFHIVTASWRIWTSQGAAISAGRDGQPLLRAQQELKASDAMILQDRDVDVRDK
jgi:hypothetical protein